VRRTWQQNMFVLLAGLIGLVVVSDVEGQIFGRRRRARTVGRTYVAPNYGSAGWYQGAPAYSAPTTAGYGSYGTYGGSWNYAPAYGSQSQGVGVAGAAADASAGGVVGAAATVDALPPAAPNRPGASAPPNARDLPGPAGERRPPADLDSRGPANENDRLVPLQNDRRDVTPPDRRIQEDAPPLPPAP
jgi:hypothetical protein